MTEKINSAEYLKHSKLKSSKKNRSDSKTSSNVCTLAMRQASCYNDIQILTKTSGFYRAYVNEEKN
jgi:hypothetical protein